MLLLIDLNNFYPESIEEKTIDEITEIYYSNRSLTLDQLKMARSNMRRKVSSIVDIPLFEDLLNEL